MAGSFSQSSLEELKDRVDIVDVIGRVVKLKKAGSNYKGLCPFHNEKTASFIVNEAKQRYTCYGCGEYGDSIAFVRKFYNLDFSEAVEKLASEYGVELERIAYKDDGLSRYHEVNRMAAEFFYKAFTASANPGYTYMKKRGIEPRVLKKFGIGYADASWDSLYRYLRSKGVEDQVMLDLGLISKGRNGRYHDKYRDRVMFPIINTRGKVIGFGGRTLSPDGIPKYLNSDESRVFQKKNNLYGLNISRQYAAKAGNIILVEGYMDAISLYQSGITNVCASLGTALTPNQARLLHRYTKEVVLSYDADSAGRKAALRGIEILRDEGLRMRVLHVTDGKDPDDFVKKNGKEAFLELVNESLSYADYKLESAKLARDLSTTEGRVDYLKDAARIIAGLDPVEQQEYQAKVAKDMKVSVGAIAKEIRNLQQNSDPKRERAERSGGDDRGRETARPVSFLEKTLLRLALDDPKYISLIDRSGDMIVSDDAIRVYEIIKAASSGGGIPDKTAFFDSLDEYSYAIVKDIEENVRIDEAGRDEVFRDCLRTYRLETLGERAKELMTVISMADDDADPAILAKINEELKTVQDDISKLRVKIFQG